MRRARQPSAGFSSSEALHIGQELVASDVEGAERDGAVACSFENCAIEFFLRSRPREARGEHELQFGAEEADRLRASFSQVRHVDEQTRVHVQADRHAVQTDAGLVAQSPILRLFARAHARLFGVGRLDIRGRPQVDFARVAVDDDRVAVLNDFGDVRDIAHGGQRERAGDDGDMARGARLLEDDAAQPRAVVVEERCGAHRTRDEDGALRQFLRQENEALASELMQEPVGDVGQIV